MIKNLLANWKTTSAGLLMIVGAVTHLSFAIHNGTLTETMVVSEITMILGGVGLLLAGDASKSAADVKQVDAKVDQTAKAILQGDTTILPKPATDNPLTDPKEPPNP